MPQIGQWNGVERRQYPRRKLVLKLFASRLSPREVVAIDAARGGILFLVDTPHWPQTDAGLGVVECNGQQASCGVQILRVSAQPEGFYVAVGCTPTDEFARRRFDLWLPDERRVAAGGTVDLGSLLRVMRPKKPFIVSLVGAVITTIAGATGALPVVWQLLRRVFTETTPLPLAPVAHAFVVLSGAAVLVVCTARLLRDHWYPRPQKRSPTTAANEIIRTCILWMLVVTMTASFISLWQRMRWLLD